MKESVTKTIVFASDAPGATLSERVRRGELVRLTSGVYSTDVTSDLVAVTAREWPAIAGGLFPGAVVTDRSVVTGGPVGGVLYLARDGRARDVELPGLLVTARPGAGPLKGDIPLPGGLYMASKGRGLAENTRPSRSRTGRVRRTLDEAELGDWIDRLCQVDGSEKLGRYRAEAEDIADLVGAPDGAAKRLSHMIGAALGTQQVATSSRALAARQASLPYDHDRMRLFKQLADGLRQAAPQNRPVPDPRDPRYEYLPFFEAYFSNFIEGTEFEMDEAVAIVYDGKRMPGRAGDTHDLVGTYALVSDLTEMTTLAASPTEFLDLLRTRHAMILGGRPDKRPGLFKERTNRAGDSLFVLPGLVAGTLSAGWEGLAELDTAFERAVYMTFLVSEVHPFDDGNGRLARAMMNAELVSGGQSRIIIPTVFRDDYLGGLRQLTRQSDATVLIKALRYAHDYTARIDFSALDGATQALRTTNAFNEPGSSDRLQLPPT